MKKKSDIYALTVFWVDTYITPLRKANPELGKIFVHSDNGEFNSEKTLAFLLKHGIYSMLVCPYTPQHNGIIERVANVDVGYCGASVNSGIRGEVLARGFWMRCSCLHSNDLCSSDEVSEVSV